MLLDLVMRSSMVTPRQYLAIRHGTSSSECPIAQAAETGDGVHASGIPLEKARYRERAVVDSFTELRLGR